MKKSLFWSFLAATAMMTACSDDAFNESQQPVVAGEEVPIPFIVNIGSPVATYATNVEKTGWANYLDGKLGDGIYARATLQVYANEGEKPYAQVRKVLETIPTDDPATDDVDESRIINLDNLRLAAGNNYTAVIWVDFIKSKTSTTEARNDYFWGTENLANVKDLGFVEDELMSVESTPEARDAYSGVIQFTVGSDGTYKVGDAEDGNKNTVAIPISAERKLAKVSLVLTDYNNKTDWTNAFNNIGDERLLNYIGMQIEDMSCAYNALKQRPIVDSQAFSFIHRKFTFSDDPKAEDINGVKWYEVEEDGETYVYPIFDFNYIIPAVADKNSADAIYTMRFRGFHYKDEAALPFTIDSWVEVGDDIYDENTPAAVEPAWKLVAKRDAHMVPVRTNAHTIIKMNMYQAYKCTVTVVDMFDGGSHDVTISDDEINVDVDDHYIGDQPNDETNDTNAHVIVTRDDNINLANGNDLGTATRIQIFNVTKDNFDRVMDDIAAMKKLGDTPIEMQAASLPATADFSDVPAANTIKLQVTDEILTSTTLTGLNSELHIAGITTNEDAKLTIKTQNIVRFQEVSGSADPADDKISTYNGEVQVENLMVNGVLSTTGYAHIDGGTFNNNFLSYVNADVNGGTLSDDFVLNTNNYEYALKMMGTDNKHTLTINKMGDAFGPIDAVQKNGAAFHDLKFKVGVDKAKYNSFAISNFNQPI